jgi:hypothetical protein
MVEDWQVIQVDSGRIETETKKTRHVHSARRTGRVSKLLHQLQLRIITEGSLDRLRSLAGTILGTKRPLQHVEGTVTTKDEQR